MSHGVMIPSKVAAKNVEALVRSAKSATIDFDNGNVCYLHNISATSGEGEVWIASTPVSALPADIWMVGEPEIVITNAQYKGLDPDPRNFYNPALSIFTIFKPSKYDMIRLTADNFATTRGTETYGDIAAAQKTFSWAATSTSATMLHLIEVTTIPLAGGSPGHNRITAYRCEVINA